MKKAIKEVKAIVIGNDHYNTLGMIRSLGERNVHVYLILTSKVTNTYVNYCKFVSQTIRVEEEENKIVNSILRIINPKDLCFLFPLTDFSARTLDKYYYQFPSNVIVPNLHGNMAVYLNKEYTKQFVKNKGISVANSIVVDLSNDFSSVLWGKYPSVMKPVISIEGLKSDILTIHNRQELLIGFRSFLEKGYKEVLVEEFIGNSSDHMIEVMGYCTKGTVEICGIIEKIREYPINNGSTAFARFIDKCNGVDIMQINSFLSDIQYDGLFDIEFKTSNGKAVFIECNFRNGAPGYALSCIGKNIALGWINAHLGYEITNNKVITKKKYFMCEQNDIMNCIKGEVHLFDWFHDFCIANKIFGRINDPIPSIKYFIMLLCLMFNRIRG